MEFGHSLNTNTFITRLDTLFALYKWRGVESIEVAATLASNRKMIVPTIVKRALWHAACALAITCGAVHLTPLCEMMRNALILPPSLSKCADDCVR